MNEPLPRRDDRPSDAALVEAARRGDMAAKEALFHRYVAMASGLAFRLIGRDTELDDIVQESFAEAFAGLGRLTRPQAFAAWFSAIVTATAIATLRRRRLLSRFGLLGREAVQLEQLIAPTTPPDIALELRAVYGAIDALRTEDRVVLILRRIEQLPLDEIASRTGWSLATVKRRLTRATEQLERATGRAEDPG